MLWVKREIHNILTQPIQVPIRSNQIHHCDACCQAIPALSRPSGYKWGASVWNLRAEFASSCTWHERGPEIEPRRHQSLNIWLIIFAREYQRQYHHLRVRVNFSPLVDILLVCVLHIFLRQ